VAFIGRALPTPSPRFRPIFFARPYVYSTHLPRSPSHSIRCPSPVQPIPAHFARAFALRFAPACVHVTMRPCLQLLPALRRINASGRRAAQPSLPAAAAAAPRPPVYSKRDASQSGSRCIISAPTQVTVTTARRPRDPSRVHQFGREETIRNYGTNRECTGVSVLYWCIAPRRCDLR
jgi:hypothetical protein